MHASATIRPDLPRPDRSRPLRRALRAALAVALATSAFSAAAAEPPTLAAAHVRVIPGPIPAYALMLVAPDDAPLAVHALAGAPAALGDLSVPARPFGPAGEEADAAFAAWVDGTTEALGLVPDPRSTDGFDRLRSVLDEAVGAEAVRVAPERTPQVVPPGDTLGILLTPLATDARDGHPDVAFEPVVHAAIGDGPVRAFPLFGPVRWPAWP